MANRNQMMQRAIRQYKFETKKTEINMHDVAKWVERRLNWKMPIPPDPLDMLAKQFSAAAREEIRHDKKTHLPYRANHAMVVRQGGQQLTLWIDIDEAPRKPMLKCLQQRREQMVGDGLQLTFDQEHWNRIHPDEEPIQLPMDITDDVLWRINAPGKKAS
jgi:hypothetical protein